MCLSNKLYYVNCTAKIRVTLSALCIFLLSIYLLTNQRRPCGGGAGLGRGIEIKPQIRCLTYRPFHKTLPRSSAFVNWISVRYYETG